MNSAFQKMEKKILSHKKLIAIVLVAVAAIVSGVYFYNLLIDRFSPQSRIDFTVYTPNAEQRNRQLVVEDYMKGSFNPFVHRNVKVITNDIYGVGSLITEQKSNGTAPGCSGEFTGKCSIKHTASGQEYAYTTYSHIVPGGDTFKSEWIHYKKNDTDIIVNRDTYADRPITNTDWDAYISSFQPAPVSQLDSFFHIGDKQVSFGP